MKSTLRHTTLSALATLLLASCQGETTGPGGAALTALLNRDVARVAADQAAEDIGLMADPGLVQFQPGATMTAGPGDFFGNANCPRQNGRFVCPHEVRDGVTVTRSFTFFDANGAEQTAYDALLTAAVNFKTTLTGEISRESWSASVNRSRDFTASGLLGVETSRTWNGTGTGVILSSRHTDGGDTRSYDMTYTTSAINVVVPVPRAEGAWPLSGSIRGEVTVTIIGGANDGVSRTRSAVITFNGTQFVPLTVNGETFTLDLGTRRIVKT